MLGILNKLLQIWSFWQPSHRKTSVGRPVINFIDILLNDAGLTSTTETSGENMFLGSIEKSKVRFSVVKIYRAFFWVMNFLSVI